MRRKSLQINSLQVSLNWFVNILGDLLQGRPPKKQQFWNLMYIMLLKVYCSSFSAVKAYTFDWLTDGQSSIKRNLNRLIKRVCFRVRSINKEIKWNVHSEKYSTWYMKKLWKIQYKFADARIIWLTVWYYSSTLTRYCTFNISYRKRQHIFFALSFYNHY